MADEKSLVSEIQRNVQARQNGLRRLDQEVIQSVAYALCNQWAEIHPDQGLWSPPQMRGEQRLTLPLIPRVLSTKLSRLTGSRPVWSATPQTAEQGSIHKAQLSIHALEWAWQVTDMDRKFQDWVWWALVSPRSWLKVAWDPNAGRAASRMLMDPTTGLPVTDPYGAPQTETVAEGMPEVTVVPYWSMIWPADCTWEGDARWCIHGQAMPVEVAEERWGVRPTAGNMDGTNRFWRMHTTEGLRASPGVYGLTGASQESAEDMCIVYEYWVRPCKRYPGGLIATCSGDKLLGAPRPLLESYHHGELPFCGISEQTVGSSIYGDWVIRRLIDAQDEINIRASQLSEHCRIASNPVWVRDALDGSNWEEMDGGIGRQIVSDLSRGRGPHWESAGSLSPDVHADIAKFQDMFFRIAEAETLTQDMSPDSSGTAISARIEGDESLSGSTRSSIGFALRRSGKMMLQIFRQYVTEPRQVRILGTDARPIVAEFTGEQIDPDVDIRVTLESATKYNKTVKNDTIIRLLQTVDPTPEMLEKVVPLLEVGGLEAAFREAAEDEEFVYRQITRVKRSLVPEGPLEYELLERTERVLRLYLNSSEFEELEDGQKAALVHTWRLKRAVLESMQAEMAMKLQEEDQARAAIKGKAAAARGGPVPESGAIPSEGEM